MIMTEREASVSCSSHNCNDVGNNEVELSEAVCSVEFISDECTSPIDDTNSRSTSPSQASSLVQFSIPRRTLIYDKGQYKTGDHVEQTTLNTDDSLSGNKGLNAAVQGRHQHTRVSYNSSFDSISSTKPTSPPTVTGNDCNCFRSVLLRCKGGTRRWSKLSNSGSGNRGTIQTFSFADSKLGYLTASKGALVVRVKSCRTTPHHPTVMSRKTRVPAAAAAADNPNIKTRCCSHLADETGNFTLVQRRWSAVNKLCSARVAAETVGTHQLTYAGCSPSTVSAGGDLGEVCSSDMSIIALSVWQRLLELFVGLQSASRRSYSLIK